MLIMDFLLSIFRFIVPHFLTLGDSTEYLVKKIVAGREKNSKQVPPLLVVDCIAVAPLCHQDSINNLTDNLSLTLCKESKQERWNTEMLDNS